MVAERVNRQAHGIQKVCSLLTAATPADCRGNGHDGGDCGGNHKGYQKAVGCKKGLWEVAPSPRYWGWLAG